MAATQGNAPTDVEKSAASAELTFVSTEIPDVATGAGRPARPNPFVVPVQTLAASWDETEKRSTGALSVTIPTSQQGSARRQLSKAANELDPPRSPRVSAKENGKSTVLTFWLVPRIERARLGE